MWSGAIRSVAFLEWVAGDTWSSFPGASTGAVQPCCHRLPGSRSTRLRAVAFGAPHLGRVS